MAGKPSIAKAVRWLVLVCATILVLAVLASVIGNLLFPSGGQDCDSPCSSTFEWALAIAWFFVLLFCCAVVAIAIVWRVITWGMLRLGRERRP